MPTDDSSIHKTVALRDVHFCSDILIDIYLFAIYPSRACVPRDASLISNETNKINLIEKQTREFRYVTH